MKSMDKVFNSVEKKADLTEVWIAKVETLLTQRLLRKKNMDSFESSAHPFIEFPKV